MTADLIIERGRRVLHLEAAALADAEHALGPATADERHVAARAVHRVWIVSTRAARLNFGWKR